MESRRCISVEFVDLIMYSVYRAAYELLGKDTWKLVWMSGRVMYERLERELNLSNTSDVYEVLSKLATWLKGCGYVDEAEVRKVSEEEFEYVMSKPAIARGAEELVKEGLVPPHISTSLMFAALRKRGLKAELIGEPTFLPDGRVIERWRIRPALHE